MNQGSGMEEAAPSSPRLPRGVVWITGASSGIGRAAAELLAARGWRVAASARDEAALSEMASQVDEIHAYPLDVADAAARREVFRRIREDLGPLDALVNNAGYGLRGALEEVEAGEARAMFDVNVLAPLALTRLVLPEMRARRTGRIVMVSSVVGRVAMPLSGLYSATKFALEGLSDALRAEVAPWGIDVILVEPGPIATRFGSTARALSRAKLSREDSPYRHAYRRLLRSPLYAPERAWGPRPVAEAIRDALESDRPKVRYPVHLVAVWLPRFARLLPARWMDRLLASRIGLGAGRRLQ